MTSITNVWNSIKGDERFAESRRWRQAFWLTIHSMSKSKDDIELLQEAGNEFSEEAILAGELTPVFFGSALD